MYVFWFCLAVFFGLGGCVGLVFVGLGGVFAASGVGFGVWRFMCFLGWVVMDL